MSFFLAIEQGTPFAAAAAAGSIGGAAASALFTVAYAALARRFAWPASLAGASLAFFAGIGILRALPLGSDLPVPLLPLYLGTLVCCGISAWLIAEPGHVAPGVPAPRWDLPARMAVATALVVSITTAAPVLGPQLTGLLTTYPIYASVLAVFAHAQRGPVAATHVIRGLCFGLLAFASFFFTIGALIDRAGIVVGFAAAIAAALAVTDSFTFPLSAREIGQLSFAPSAACLNFSASAPGTSPRTSSADDTTVQLSPTLSNVTFALTSSRFGGVPARASPAESAIEKHEACAAARSSSGLDLPLGASVRALHDTGASLKSPLDPAVTIPLPLMRSPFQTARASLVAATSHLPAPRAPPKCRSDRGHPS